MSDEEVTVSLSGLTALEVAELRSALTEAGADPAVVLTATKERSDVAGPRKGEPATILVVIAAGQLAITGLALYLAKGRARTRSKEKILIVGRHGERLEYERDIATDKQEAIKADLMEQVSKMKIPTPGKGAS